MPYAHICRPVEICPRFLIFEILSFCHNTYENIMNQIEGAEDKQKAE